MKINLSPQVGPGELVLVKSGDTLTINGEDFDFSVIPDGATLPADAVDSDHIIDKIERIDGELHLTLLFPIRGDASAAARFPQPIVDPADGPVELPDGGVGGPLAEAMGARPSETVTTVELSGSPTPEQIEAVGRVLNGAK